MVNQRLTGVRARRSGARLDCLGGVGGLPRTGCRIGAELGELGR